MSTNSIIAKQYGDGTIKSIYCHWDGYYECNGRILNEDYKVNFKVDDLIELGEISSLGKTLYPSPLVKKFGFDHFGNEEFIKLSKEKRDEYVSEGISSLYTIAYGRDRGVKGVECVTHASLDDFNEFCKREEFVEFVYLFKNGEWYAKENGIFSESVEFRKLSEIMEEIYEREDN